MAGIGGFNSGALLQGAAVEEDAAAEVLKEAVDWRNFLDAKEAGILTNLSKSELEEQSKQLIAEGSATVASILTNALKIKEPTPTLYVLTLYCELGKTDAQLFSMLPLGLTAPLKSFLSTTVKEAAANSACYLFSTILAHAGSKAEPGLVKEFTKAVIDKKYNVTEVGMLDAICNLLKSPDIRKGVWETEGVKSVVTEFSSGTAVPVLYKCCFSIWMVSFDADLLSDLKSLGAIQQLRKILQTNRTEKVVRVSLLALRNLLGNADTAEEVVEAGAGEAVEALEYEKWRDPEVYDSVKAVASSIQSAVAHHSNFNRYEREIKQKKLNWGFIHSDKFWNENYLAFEKDDFAVVKALVDIVSDDRKDAITLSVACHDIGEFARLHPSGKSVLSRWPRAKAMVMERMGHEDREVAREALLCTQKLMLNRWQDLQETK
jgi:V-type H+-transporting ATPase subunit H